MVCKVHHIALLSLTAFFLVSLVESTVEGKRKAVDNAERERNQRVRYTSSWAVEISEGGDKAADLLARRHGYRNLGKVRIPSLQQ